VWSLPGWLNAGLCMLVVVVCVSASPVDATAEQASQPGSAAAAGLDVGNFYSCALTNGGSVRCWGFGADGQLGYGATSTIGDNETPSAVGPVNVGAGRTVKAISAGDYHTCALLDDGTVRCWGFGADGRLGYANTNNIGDVAPPAAVGPVNLGPGRIATAISANGGHTCAVLDNGSVRCWGYGFNGELGYGNQDNIGDNETPAAAGPVNLGLGRTAKAITAGERHTCALLDDDSVRCWGNGGSGRLGYGNQTNIGDNETPDTAGPVNLGTSRTAVAISAGAAHTCAVLDDATIRCWGFGASGQLGYGNTNSVGATSTTTPNTVGPVNLGLGRTAKAISAGAAHTCALLDDGSARCWGYGGNGRLGYASTNTIGDNSTPDTAGPVNLGFARTATAISAGQSHTCARRDDGSVLCWGSGANGRLGYCNQDPIGDDEAPGTGGPVDLEPGDNGARCKPLPSLVASGVPYAGSALANANGVPTADSDTLRARALRSCLARAATRAKQEQRLPRRSSTTNRRSARRHAARRRQQCLHRFGRTPGRVNELHARTLSKTKIALVFNATGTDARHPPPARTYVVKQSLRPIRSGRDFARARTLCHGHCRFEVTRVGGLVSLTVTDLPPRTSYYYAVAGRDNVSGRRGPRSHTVKAKTS